MWTKVSLKDAKLPFVSTYGSGRKNKYSHAGNAENELALTDLGSKLDVLLRTALDLLLGRHFVGLFERGLAVLDVVEGSRTFGNLENVVWCGGTFTRV